MTTDRIPYGCSQTHDGRATIIDPKSAAVVRCIYQDYAAGVSPIQIANVLTRQDIPATGPAAGLGAPSC